MRMIERGGMRMERLILDTNNMDTGYKEGGQKSQMKCLTLHIRIIYTLTRTRNRWPYRHSPRDDAWSPCHSFFVAHEEANNVTVSIRPPSYPFPSAEYWMFCHTCNTSQSSFTGVSPGQDARIPYWDR
ncbi:hypothetical protein D9758_008807 [Tetrapyrgos nigripes]|uniref:Uncharacterized protein n=1 Tax=Tetrapyrgos nigripes TaxID=182062 RepID=A0A8H5FY82_9AGAR|nr:hypothetical protein D9758_008807 [Tetrapyrgos nigripes]